MLIFAFNKNHILIVYPLQQSPIQLKLKQISLYIIPKLKHEFYMIRPVGLIKRLLDLSTWKNQIHT